MIEVGVNLTDKATPALKKIIALLDGQEISQLNQVGARSATNASIDYHRGFNQKKGWRGSNYISGPGRKSGDFGQNIILGWNFVSATKNGATIQNGAPFFAQKVNGGTIRPKKAKALTIPMVSEAVGRRAADYQSSTGNILFKITGKNALFEKKEDGSVRPVYALVKQVTQKPWPKALPDRDLLEESFTKGWMDAFADKIDAL